MDDTTPETRPEEATRPRQEEPAEGGREQVQADLDERPQPGEEERP